MHPNRWFCDHRNFQAPAIYFYCTTVEFDICRKFACRHFFVCWLLFHVGKKKNNNPELHFLLYNGVIFSLKHPHASCFVWKFSIQIQCVFECDLCVGCICFASLKIIWFQVPIRTLCSVILWSWIHTVSL